MMRKMDGLAVFIALILCTRHVAANKSCVPEYNTSSSRVPGKINIHLMPHTHDDTGWLKTVDQYYYGSRQDIQLAGVQYVLDTVIYALEKNPNRRFSYAEMSFFTRWWHEQTAAVQDSVKRLVKNGQLNFLNGGWVQHDEAASHYVAMIDQTTRGHRFLEETFGIRPRVGWQIDPFGHSATQASLMAGYLGFDALFFGRSDYQDLALRKKAKQLEFVWRGAKSYGKDADVFTGSFPTGNYGPPGGFYFEWGNWDAPVQDNVCLTELNVEQRVEDFVNNALEYSELYTDMDIWWPVGTDFTYSNAFTWFKNYDKLIHYVNKDGRVNAFYSTPEEYVQYKHSRNTSWPLKSDDFFPYADCPNCFWTGYFTSRPTSKGHIKAATSYLQLTRQLELVTNTPGASDHLEEAVCLLQHHDSITGTEKQHVANDYHKRLAKGFLHAQRFVSKALSHLVYNIKGAAATLAEKLRVEEAPADPADGLLLLLQQCPKLNISVCEISLTSSQKNDAFLVVAYNPLAWSRKAPVRVPITVSANTAWHVVGPNGENVESQLVAVSNVTSNVQKILHENGALPDLKNAGAHEIAFLAHLPPLGYATYTISNAPPNQSPDRKAHLFDTTSPQPAVQSTVTSLSQDPRWNVTAGANDEVAVTQGNLSLMISASTGRIISYKYGLGDDWKFSIDGAWYESHQDEGNEISSGAYIFRPDNQRKAKTIRETTIVDGPVFSEMQFDIFDFLSVTARLWKHLHYLEIEYTAGPIPIGDNQGKEVVIQYQTELKSGTSFLTDSNGRELLTRKLDYRPTWDLEVTQPVAGNYYPLTAAIALQADNGDELSVLVDRAVGGSSLTEGEIEVMVHRRTLRDDQRGVAEPLNETVATCLACDSPGLIVRGTHLVALNHKGDGAGHRRHLQQLINDPILLSFGPVPPDTSNVKLRRSFSAMPLAQFAGIEETASPARKEKELPKNVHLLTSKLLDDDEALIRLAHLFQVGENAGSLAEAVDVDLNSLFAGLSFEHVEEYGLAAAQPLSKIERLHFRAGEPINNGKIDRSQQEAEVPDYKRPAPFFCQTGCQNKELNITLQPMEIRTFIGKVAGGYGGLKIFENKHDVTAVSHS